MSSMKNKKKSKKQASKIPAMLLIVAAFLIIGGALTLIAHRFMGFQSHADTFGPFEHRVGTAAFVPPADIWSDANITRYENGVGLHGTFVKILPDGKKAAREFNLAEWKHYQEEGDNPKRRRTVAAAHKEFDEMVGWLNRRDSYPVRKLVIVDMTGGVGVNGAESLPISFVADEVGLRQLKDAFDAGDSVELFGCKISADREVDCRQSKADKNNAFKSVEDVGHWLYEKSGDAKETSLYEGFVNIVDWFKVNGISIPEIKIVSDGTENSPETASFYTLAREGKLKPVAGYPALFDKVFARKLKQIPDLSGVSVTLVGPPYGKGAVRDRIEESLAFASYSFGERMHANVQVRYR